MTQLFGRTAPAAPDHSGNIDLAPSSAGVRVLGSGPEQAFFRLDVKRSLQLHWKLARAVAIGFTALAVVYFLVQALLLKAWPAYLAESTVYVQPTPAKVLPSEGGPPRWPFDSNTYETYIQQQMLNVSRQDVLIGALHKLNGFERAGESDQAAARRLVRSLEVTRVGDAYQFSIGARAKDPETAAQIANAVTAAYIESATRDERTGDAQRLAMLKEEKDRIQSALAADRAEQDTLNSQLGVASLGSTVPDQYDADIAQIRSELDKARTDHDEAEQKFASLDAGHGPSSAAIDAQADQLIASDPGLVSMKQASNVRRAALISQMANLTPVNPQYKLDEQELVKINGTLEAMMKDLRAKAAARIQVQLRSDLQRTGGVESELNRQLRQMVGAASSATPKLQRSSDLAADNSRLRARYAAVDEQMHNLMLEDSAPAAAYQVSPAVPPLNRSKSGVLRNAVLLLFAGLVFGILAAVSAHKLDPKIYIAADVERALGFQPLAQLPDFSEVSEGTADEYMLRLASAIEHGRKQGNLKNCIFTGTSPGTGVSTLVNRVGKMLEAMGRSTVLVDATGAQAPDSRPGSDARAGASGREGAQGLVPAHRVSRPTALLQQMVEETGTGEQSLVLTDTAPLAVSAETEYLARFVDCVLVVVESGVTTRAQLRDTAATLERLGVGAVGFVLNRVGMAKADPAFREAADAVDKHLRAQAAHGSGNVSKPVSSASEKTAARDELPRAPSSHPLFEPEIAAAAAAVARFSPSSPTAKSHVKGAPACLPSPTVPMAAAPVAEAAKRFSSTFVNAPIAEPAEAEDKEVVAEAAADSVTTAEAEEVVAEAPAPADFVATAEPLAEVQAEIEADAGAAEAPSSPLEDEPEAAGPAEPPVSPFAEAAKRFSSGLPSGPPVAFSPRPVSAPPANALPVGPEEPSQPVVAAENPASEPELVEEQEPVLARKQEPEHPAVSAEPNAPWWLSESPRNLEPVRPPVLWQPAKVSHSRQRSDEAASAPAGPEDNPELRHTWPEPQHAWVTATQLLERAPAQTPEPGVAPVTEDAPATRSSRLSGLRNLLFVLGVKNAREEEQREHQGGAATNPERKPERQDYERTLLEARETAERSIGSASPRLVTAPPEFLPPKPMVIEFDKTDARVGESSTRQDRRASADGVQILPSKHGQYKKV
jgi:succinoglycan biosynthesis transport protein ExoP